MSGDAQNSQQVGRTGTDEFLCATSFHKDLMTNEKQFRERTEKPDGKYDSKWNTSANDKSMKNADGTVTLVSEHKTEMSSSYSYNQNQGGCAIM